MSDSSEQQSVLSSRSHLSERATQTDVPVYTTPSTDVIDPPAPRIQVPDTLPDFEADGQALESQPDFKPTSRIDPWWRLILILIMAAVPWLWGLRDTPCLNQAELTQLELHTQTFDHLHLTDRNPETTKLERLAPRDSAGQPVFNLPPVPTWVHLVASTGLSPTKASLSQLHYRARLSTVILGLLSVAAVFWCGYSLGGLSTATFAGLMFASQPFVAFWFRQARPEGVQLSLALLSMAAALWAIRPLRPMPSFWRQSLGWIMAGIFLGGATGAGGPTSVLPTLVPLLLMVIMVPHRTQHILGFVAALGMAALTLLPWAILVHTRYPEAAEHWVNMIQPDWRIFASHQFFDTVLWRLLVMACLLFIWIPWLSAALLQPFFTHSPSARSRIFTGGAWFLSALLILLLQPRGQILPAVLLTMLPPACVYLGQILRRFDDLAMSGQPTKLWQAHRGVGTMVVLCLAILPVFIPTLLNHWPELVPVENIRTILLNLEWSQWLKITIPSCLLAGIGALCAFAHAPLPMVLCWSLWSAWMTLCSIHYLVLNLPTIA